MFGIQIPGGFDLSTRITRRIAEEIVGADESGSFIISPPPGLTVAVTAIPLSGDSNMRHFGHHADYDPITKVVNYWPSITTAANTLNIPAIALPARSASIILVMAYIP